MKLFNRDGLTEIQLTYAADARSTAAPPQLSPRSRRGWARRAARLDPGQAPRAEWWAAAQPAGGRGLATPTTGPIPASARQPPGPQYRHEPQPPGTNAVAGRAVGRQFPVHAHRRAGARRRAHRLAAPAARRSRSDRYRAGHARAAAVWWPPARDDGPWRPELRVARSAVRGGGDGAARAGRARDSPMRIQRGVGHLSATGEIVGFGRSWYNRTASRRASPTGARPGGCRQWT